MLTATGAAQVGRTCRHGRGPAPPGGPRAWLEALVLLAGLIIPIVPVFAHNTAAGDPVPVSAMSTGTADALGDLDHAGQAGPQGHGRAGHEAVGLDHVDVGLSALDEHRVAEFPSQHVVEKHGFAIPHGLGRGADPRLSRAWVSGDGHVRALTEGARRCRLDSER